MVSAGVDVGSVATKVVILDGRRTVLAREVSPTGPHGDRIARELFQRALRESGLSEGDVCATVATGYGRRRVDFASQVVTEISACAKGLRWSVESSGASCLAIDLGGQDTKVILLSPDGSVEDFVMNDKCAAGTGKFLEVMAASLQVKLDDLPMLARKARQPVRINSTCTVFAESEVISLLSEGRSVEDIVAGLHLSIAERIAAMAMGFGRQETVYFCGGGAKNEGLRTALAEKLGAKVVVPDQPQFVNALGAAIIALEEISQGGG